MTVFSNSVSGVIYRDLNNNGTYEPGAGETLVTTPVALVLAGTDHLGNPVTVPLTTTTGTYSFTGLRPGTYAVTQVTQPAGLLDGRDTPGTSSPGTLFGGTGTAATAPRNPRDADAITNIVVGTGQNKAGVDYNFGEIPAGSVGDFVWVDANGNGRQDAGEPGRDGVGVTLSGTDDTGAAVSRTVTTAGGGAYTFSDVRPGTYTVTFAAPAGFGFTVRDSAVATDATDSDADPYTGRTAVFTQGVGQADPTRDAGLYQPAAVGDFVWYDVDTDGALDPGEPGIPGVTVILDDAGLDGEFGTADDVTGSATQQTTGTGAYLFANLRPGTYRVRVVPLTLPNGVVRPTFDFDGIATANRADATLASGQSNTDVDFGYATQPPPQNGAQLGDLVWYDINRDGSSAGEPGISGVTVTAVWLGFDDVEGTADDVTFTTTTDVSGTYGFTGLPLGRYRVSVDPATLPPTRFETFDLDGIATPSTTLASLTLLRPVELGADFGYFSVPAVGDFVWYDFNGDGVQDPDEPGIPGVTVTLTGTAPDGTPITLTRTTGALGRYVFTGIPGGVFYTVTVSGLPAAVTNTFDRDGNRNSQTTFLLGAGETIFDADFGYQGNNSLAGFVYRDFNVNGLREPAGTNPRDGHCGRADHPDGHGHPGQYLHPLGHDRGGRVVLLRRPARRRLRHHRGAAAVGVRGRSGRVLRRPRHRRERGRDEPGEEPVRAPVHRGHRRGRVQLRREPAGRPVRDGPPAVVGNDRFDTVILAPFPVRGPFNFGERILPEPPTPVPPINPIPPVPQDFSKRMFLASTVLPLQPPVLTADPNFAAFGAPAVRAISFAAVAEGVGGLVRVFDYTAGTERFRFAQFGDFTGGVRVTTADVTRDGIPDVVTVPGPGADRWSGCSTGTRARWCGT